jgi:hypothetical protein
MATKNRISSRYRGVDYRNDPETILEEYPLGMAATAFGLGVIVGLVTVALIRSSEDKHGIADYARHIPDRLSKGISDVLAHFVPGSCQH